MSCDKLHDQTTSKSFSNSCTQYRLEERAEWGVWEGPVVRDDFCGDNGLKLCVTIENNNIDSLMSVLFEFLKEMCAFSNWYTAGYNKWTLDTSEISGQSNLICT